MISEDVNKILDNIRLIIGRDIDKLCEMQNLLEEVQLLREALQHYADLPTPDGLVARRALGFTHRSKPGD